MIRVTEVDGNQELRLLASLVYNDKVIAAVAHLIDRDTFRSPFCYRLAAFCVRFYHKYHRAPKSHISSYVGDRISASSGKEEVKALQQILTAVEDCRRSVNGKSESVEYLIDSAKSYIQRQRVRARLEQAKDAFDEGDLEKVESVLRRVKLGEAELPTLHNPGSDESIEQLLKSREKSIIQFTGALSSFFGSHLRREQFVVFQGPEKSFKSFWLQEMAVRALKAKLRVLHVGVCDMSTVQYDKRFYSRIAGRPIEKGTYYYPTGWHPQSDERWWKVPVREERLVEERVKGRELKRARDRFCQKYLGTSLDRFYKTLAIGAIGVSEIDTIIQQMQDLQDWSPDVLVVDYADRLSPPRGIQDKLTQIDHNWCQLRDMAFRHQMLVISATQGRRSTYRGDYQKREDVADQKNKTGIVTGLIGICATEEEFRLDTRRLNWIVSREHQGRLTVSVAGCPAIGNPAVISC